MGLAATYAVVAAGSSLTYQWSKNGSAIEGATAATYVTPATQFTDDGAAFTVTVSNSAGAVTSTPASLAVTARAPRAGDLRFQQVDSPATVNGWNNDGTGLSTTLLGRGAMDLYPGLGTPLFVGSAGNCAVPPVTDGTGCGWSLFVTPMVTSATSPALLAGYASDTYDNLSADMTDPAFTQLGGGASPSSSASVLTSLDLEPDSALFALSWVQSSQQGGFAWFQNVVQPAQLQAAATQEGAAGRVITALSGTGGPVTYFAYGWSADTATLYEAQVVTATSAGAPAAAAGLAAQGYIITATGQADNAGNILIVGTRVAGDTLPRPFMSSRTSAEFGAMAAQGYAVVGVIVDLSDTASSNTYLGER